MINCNAVHKTLGVVAHRSIGDHHKNCPPAHVGDVLTAQPSVQSSCRQCRCGFNSYRSHVTCMSTMRQLVTRPATSCTRCASSSIASMITFLESTQWVARYRLMRTSFHSSATSHSGNSSPANEHALGSSAAGNSFVTWFCVYTRRDANAVADSTTTNST